MRVLDVLKEHALKAIIHVCSSCEVYGRVPPEKLPIDEECSFHASSPYAISKVGTDLAARFYAEAYGMTVMSTRMFNHTGPRRGDVFAESTFAKQIAMIECGRIPPVVKVGNLQSLRTISDVRDAVQRLPMLVTIAPVAGCLLQYRRHAFLHDGGAARHADLLLTRKAEIKVEVDPQRLRPIDADRQIPNTAKFTAHTGWKPEIPTTRRCATCSTTGATAWQRKATAS